MSVTTFTEEELEALEDKWTLPRFVFFPGGLLGLWCLGIQWPNDHWAWQVFWTLFTSFNLLCWTSCFHETVHQTLNGSRLFSIWLGRFLGTAMLVPYSVYRESHIRHHAYLNKPSDWELWPYCDPNASKAFRRVFVWIDLVFGFVVSSYIYGRLYFHKDSPLKSPELRRVIRNEYLVILVFWGTIIGIVAWYGAWLGLLRVWVIPHLVTGIWQTGRKLTEHLGMASYDPLLGTRTVLGRNLFTRISTYLNFDIFIHGPHHRHPRIAHNQLGNKMKDYIEQNPDQEFPLFSTYLHATGQMVPFLFKNPGVGMNVGAPPPSAEKDQDVQNFVADVAEEILA